MNIRAATPVELDWLVSRVGYNPTAGLRGIAAIDAGGALAGVVGFDNWGPNVAEMHFALATPIALRQLATAGFEYVFSQVGLEYLIGLTPASKSVILGWRARVGFEEIHRLKDGFAKGDDLVYSVLHRDKCRFWKKGPSNGHV